MSKKSVIVNNKEYKIIPEAKATMLLLSVLAEAQIEYRNVKDMNEIEVERMTLKILREISKEDILDYLIDTVVKDEESKNELVNNPKELMEVSIIIISAYLGMDKEETKLEKTKKKVKEAQN